MYYYIVYFNHFKGMAIFNRYYDAKRFCDTFYNEDSLIVEGKLDKEE